MKRKLFLLLTLLISVASFGYKQEDVTVNVNGQNRTMVVFSPTTTSTKMPLMIVTHGMNQDPKYQYDMDKMYQLVDKEKFVCAYLKSDGNTWDIGGTKDQSFVLKTIDAMYTKFGIDKNRVYWSGFSMGSMLIYHCMANVVDKIAAFAPTSGVQFSESPWNSCKKPVNLIHCHSYKDEVFGYDKYEIHDYVAKMAKMNKFSTYFKSDNFATGGLTGVKETWTNINTGKVVTLFSYNEGGHWPQQDCGKEIWAFCKKFSLADNTQEKETVVLQKGQMTQPTEFDPNFHIYLCFGQSNMEGNAAIEAQDCKNVDSRFRMMAAVNMSNTGRVMYNWYTAYPPLCRGGNGLTPADYFGRMMVASLPDSIKVGVINVAVGGASIKLFDEETRLSQINGAEEWFKNYCKEYNNNPYQRLVTCAKKAQKVGVIKGILLHQGCTDNTQQDWPVRVKRVYQRLLKDLDLKEEETPLIAGELLQQNMGGVCWGHNSVIAHLKDAVPNTYVASSNNCPAAADGLHFTAEGYRIIGKRYAEKMLAVLDSTKKIDYADIYTPFPLTDKAFNPSLYLQGSYKLQGATGMFTTASYGNIGGWRYSKGIDFSSHKYLIINILMASKTCSVKVYDTDDVLSPCYTIKPGTKKKIVIDLENMKTDNGKVVDPSHIYMIGLSDDKDKTLYIKSAYLSDDGSTPTAINDVFYDEDEEDTNCYDLNGRKIAEPAKGIYIKNGKKYLAK